MRAIGRHGAHAGSTPLEPSHSRKSPARHERCYENASLLAEVIMYYIIAINISERVEGPGHSADAGISTAANERAIGRHGEYAGSGIGGPGEWRYALRQKPWPRGKTITTRSLPSKRGTPRRLMKASCASTSRRWCLWSGKWAGTWSTRCSRTTRLPC